MPFFGSNFFDAVEGYPVEVAMAYLRAIWKYWNHTHCQGLRNDDRYLREICHCTVDQWEQFKGIIFDNEHFFCLNGDGNWHQKRAKDIHDREVELYRKRVAWAANARHSKANPNINPNINNGALSPAQIVLFDRELQTVVAKMKTIRDGYSSHQPWASGDRERFEQLRARRDELKELLNVKVT